MNNVVARLMPSSVTWRRRSFILLWEMARGMQKAEGWKCARFMAAVAGGGILKWYRLTYLEAGEFDGSRKY